MSQQIISTASSLANKVSNVVTPIISPVTSVIAKTPTIVSSAASSTASTVSSAASSTASSIASTASSTSSSVVSSIKNMETHHKDYKEKLANIAKYCIIIGLIILLSCYIMHVISYLYKEKILPYSIGLFRKIFLILGIINIIIGVFCAVAWNYYY